MRARDYYGNVIIEQQSELNELVNKFNAKSSGYSDYLIG